MSIYTHTHTPLVQKNICKENCLSCICLGPGHPRQHDWSSEATKCCWASLQQSLDYWSCQDQTCRAFLLSMFPRSWIMNLCFGLEGNHGLLDMLKSSGVRHHLFCLDFLLSMDFGDEWRSPFMRWFASQLDLQTTYMRFSINRGPLNWMVKGKSQSKYGWFRGTPILGTPPDDMIHCRSREKLLGGELPWTPGAACHWGGLGAAAGRAV